MGGDPRARRRHPARSRGKTPLIGREDETALLESLFERVVREGRPHLVTVIGPAGVGKSRLMREVVGALAARPEPAAVRVGHCPAYGARSDTGRSPR